MADVHEPHVRSYNMSQIKGKNTKPEIIVRRFLFAQGYRYKLHDRKLPGAPDIVLPKYRSVIFIHGCFWHGHDNCKYYVVPKTRTEWWLAKILGNKQRDKENFVKLRRMGWRILNIFECELKTYERAKTLRKVLRFVSSKQKKNVIELANLT